MTLSDVYKTRLLNKSIFTRLINFQHTSSFLIQWIDIQYINSIFWRLVKFL